MSPRINLHCVIPQRANETLRESASAAAEDRRQHEAAALALRRKEDERGAGEAAAREEAEAELHVLRAELESSRASKEEARANLLAVAAACREAEAKARELQEHRRVLAREVKASRAEQRRLSASLACATRAATAAAATAAAATAAKAATAANAKAHAAAGDCYRLPSSVGSVAGDEARKVEVGRGGGGEGRGEGAARRAVGGGKGASESKTNDVGDEAGGERHHGEGKGDCLGSSSPGGEGGTEAVQKNETEREEVFGPTPTHSGVKPGEIEASSSSSTVNGTSGPVSAGADEEGGFLSPPSPQPLPPPADLRASTRGSERGVGGENGATSPEAGSPGLRKGGSDSDSCGSGGDCSRSGRRRDSELDPSPSPSSDTAATSPAGLVASGSSGEETPAWSNVGVGDNGGDVNEEGGHGREMTGRADEIVAEGGTLSVDRRSLCIGANVGASVGTGAQERLKSADPAPPAASPSEASLVGESSRFVNQMVQTFSAGLRESRRARRTPLLGSLDDGSDAGDAVEEEEEEGEDNGDVTDGVDGDSRHFTAPGEEAGKEGDEGDEEDEDEERKCGAWSAWSTAVVPRYGPVAVAVKQGSGARARAEGELVGREEGVVCVQSPSGSGGEGGGVEGEGSLSGR